MSTGIAQLVICATIAKVVEIISELCKLNEVHQGILTRTLEKYFVDQVMEFGQYTALIKNLRLRIKEDHLLLRGGGVDIHLELVTRKKSQTKLNCKVGFDHNWQKADAQALLEQLTKTYKRFLVK